MSAPTLLIPEGNVNTHIGIGYNATGVVASRTEFPGGSIYLSSALNSNIGMPLTSSEYPETNTSGSYNYQPIEIVRDHLIPAYSTQLSTLAFSYDSSPTGDKFPPYSQVEVEGAMHITQTTDDIDNDLSFFKLTFQTNFDHSLSTSTSYISIKPTLETIGGVESIINTTLLYYFKEDYGSVYEKNTYFIAFKFLSKSHNRRLLTHTTFL